jgi:hypothetical protein
VNGPIVVAGMSWWDRAVVLITLIVACSFVGVNAFVPNVARNNERIPSSSRTRFLCSSLRMNAAEPSTRVARRNYLFAAVSLVPSLFLFTSKEASAKEVINDCEPWYHSVMLRCPDFRAINPVLIQDIWKEVADRKELQG